MHRTQEGWISEYQNRNTYWVHSGDAKKPHALLTSGKHSDGFFWSKPLVEDPDLCRQAAEDMVEKGLGMKVFLGALPNITIVAGPETGATALAEALASVIGKLRGNKCGHTSPKKVTVNDKKGMQFDEGILVSNDRILLVEDVITTGGSLDLVMAAADMGESVVTFAPVVFCLVNRSGQTHLGDKLIIPLVDQPMNVWEASECPLCALNSEAIPPKRPASNWALLTE